MHKSACNDSCVSNSTGDSCLLPTTEPMPFQGMKTLKHFDNNCGSHFIPVLHKNCEFFMSNKHTSTQQVYSQNLFISCSQRQGRADSIYCVDDQGINTARISHVWLRNQQVKASWLWQPRESTSAIRVRLYVSQSPKNCWVTRPTVLPQLFWRSAKHRDSSCPVSGMSLFLKRRLPQSDAGVRLASQPVVSQCDLYTEAFLPEKTAIKYHFTSSESRRFRMQNFALLNCSLILGILADSLTNKEQ